MYSQNTEDRIVKEYFNGVTGVVLDIGANDGETFSNSKLLIDSGWTGVMVEPSEKAYKRLKDHYIDNKKVYTHNLAISTGNGVSVFYESGSHIGEDVGLLSSLKKEELSRWKKEEFKEIIVKTQDYDTFCQENKYTIFNFITIDAEGMDYEILSQIDLHKYHVMCVCVETNSKDDKKYIDYCESFGFKMIYKSAENIIMAI